MKRIGIVGLCLAAMFALSAMGASSAFAGEYGICGKAAKVAGKYTGKYTDKNCQDAASEAEIAEGKKNKYEWEPGLTGNGGNPIPYTSKGKTATLKSAAGEITCKKSTDEGEITGVKTDVDTTTFTDCVLSLFKSACTSEGEPTGTIKTFPNTTELVDFPEGPKEGEVWTRYSAFSPYPVLATWTCASPFGAIPFAAEGHLAGVNSGINEAKSKWKTTFATGEGEQDLVTVTVNEKFEEVHVPSEEITSGEAKTSVKYVEVKS